MRKVLPLSVPDGQNAMNKGQIKTVLTSTPGLLLLRPQLHGDERGIFLETYRREAYRELGIDNEFVQDNLVHSAKKVFRGLHLQFAPFEQAKLITIIQGEILDIVLDLRKGSPAYLRTETVRMKADKHEQLFIPAGFAHGYYVLSENAVISYKVSNPYAPLQQGGINWRSPELELEKLIKNPLLSEQDRNLPYLEEILNNPKFLF